MLLFLFSFLTSIASATLGMIKPLKSGPCKILPSGQFHHYPFHYWVTRGALWRLPDPLLYPALLHHGCHHGGERLGPRLALCLPPFCRPARESALAPRVHLLASGQAHARIELFSNLCYLTFSQLLLSVIATMTCKGWLGSVTRHPSLLLLPTFTHFTFARCRQG